MVKAEGKNWKIIGLSITYLEIPHIFSQLSNQNFHKGRAFISDMDSLNLGAVFKLKQH